MDPMSVTFAVFGAAGSALASAQRVADFIGGIKGAPRAVENLGLDVEALRGALDSLQLMLRNIDPQSRNLQQRMVPMLQKPLDNCVTTLQDIEIKIKPYVSQSKKSREQQMNVWRAFTWTFREKDIVSLQNTLMAHKQSLDIAISIADYSKNRDDLEEVKQKIQGLHSRLNIDSRSVIQSGYAGSEGPSSDYAYPLKRWLLETETIFEDMISARGDGSPPRRLQGAENLSFSDESPFSDPTPTTDRQASHETTNAAASAFAGGKLFKPGPAILAPYVPRPVPRLGPRKDPASTQHGTPSMNENRVPDETVAFESNKWYRWRALCRPSLALAIRPDIGAQHLPWEAVNLNFRARNETDFIGEYWQIIQTKTAIGYTLRNKLTGPVKYLSAYGSEFRMSFLAAGDFLNRWHIYNGGEGILVTHLLSPIHKNTLKVCGNGDVRLQFKEAFDFFSIWTFEEIGSMTKQEDLEWNSEL